MRIFIVETPIPKAKRSGIGVSTIPRSGGFNTQQLAVESVSKACFGVHTRDYSWYSFSISFEYAFIASLRLSFMVWVTNPFSRVKSSLVNMNF